MAAKKDIKKVKGPVFEVVWNGGVPEITYFKRNEYKTVGKVEKGQFILTWNGWDEEPDKAQRIVCTPADTRKLMDSLDVKNPDTLLKVLGRKFAQKESHRAHLKIMASLDRRGVPYKSFLA